MKTLNEQIERLKELIRKCYGVVAGKNGIVPEVGERNMENLPNAIASTHDTLEELTITQNGTYTPQEGVDGFSKVTAEFNTSSLSKAKVTQLVIDNKCLTDGKWEDWKMIDWSYITSLDGAFSNVTNMTSINIEEWGITNRLTNLGSTFRWCEKLNTIDLTSIDTSNVTKFFFTFGSCRKLRLIDITGCSFKSANDISYCFSTDGSLISIIGGRTIENVISDNITCCNEVKINFITGLPNSVDRASLRALINGLADLTGRTAKTLTIGNTNIAKLTEEDIAIAVNKNWTIA